MYLEAKTQIILPKNVVIHDYDASYFPNSSNLMPNKTYPNENNLILINWEFVHYHEKKKNRVNLPPMKLMAKIWTLINAKNLAMIWPMIKS